MWDLEVDVACVGTGIGAVANAIATADAGGEALIVDATPPLPVGSTGSLRERLHTGRGWLVYDTADVETDEYLAALTEGVLDSLEHGLDESVTLREARNLSPEESHGRMEPFRGSLLNAWAAQCLTSSQGLLFSSLLDWRTTPMRSADGDVIQVFALGAVSWRDGHGAGELRRWLLDRARERDVEVRPAGTLERIVFEEGRVVGIVVSTPGGPCAIRARAGVALASSDHDSGVDFGANAAAGDTLQVCLVGRTASRYGRVELLDTEPVEALRPTCTGSRKQFRDGLHESRLPSLEGWRCGQVQGYPPLGQ